MSVSDPLLKKLKAFVLALRSKDEVVTDSHQLLKPLCENIEQIFQKGLKVTSSWLGKASVDFWPWINKLQSVQPLLRLPPVLSMNLNAIKKNKKTRSDKGRGRVLLRCALVKNFHIDLVQLLIKNPHLADQWYYETDSILGNEILREILLSLLFELKEVTFSLQLKNSSFLDVTWELPEYKFYEFVPSEDLGLDIRTIKGFPIVTQVDPASIAGEDNKIEVGDVLDEMCGQYLKGVGKSGIYFIYNQYEGQPIQMGVIKGRNKDGTTYSYIARLMERAKLGDISPTSPASPTSQSSSFDEDRLPPDAQLPEEIEDEVPVYDSEGRASYEAVYLGKSFLGKDGRVSMIEQGVGEVLNRSTSKQDILLELGEKEVVVRDRGTKEVVMQHLFTEISACGRRTDSLLHFSYIAGETYCSFAQDFYCHVFEAKNHEEAKVILCTIDIPHSVSKMVRLLFLLTEGQKSFIDYIFPIPVFKGTARPFEQYSSKILSIKQLQVSE